MRNYVAEFVATFALVFAGTGAVIVNDVYGGVVTHVGIALTFGLIVMAMIYAVGDVSGAHLNPAVTLGFLAARRMPFSRVPGYVLSQLLGAIGASLLLRFYFPDHPTLGATLPTIPLTGAFFFELILTFFLMFLILHVSTGAKEKGLMAGVAVGAIIGLEAMFAGPVTGASMNPARSLGPGVVSGSLEGLWVYLTAPFVGALLAVPFCRLLRERGCEGEESSQDAPGEKGSSTPAS